MITVKDDENKSLAWELTKDQSSTVRLMMKVLAVTVISFSIAMSVIVGSFLYYLSLYDFESTTYENSHTVEAISDNGGNANAIVNQQGEVLINGDSDS